MPSATINQLKSLLPHVLSLASLKPWEAMWEDEIFTIQPLNLPMVTVSVMGNGGQYLAIAFYVGHEARTGFFYLHSSELETPEETFPVIMSIHQIHLSFAHRSSLEPQQIKRFTAAGYFRPGRKLVPFFETIRKGSLPGDIEAEDASLLEKVLPEAVNVLNRAMDLEVDLQPCDNILVREEISAGVWQDRIHTLTDHDLHWDTSFQIRNSTEPLEKQKVSQAVWEIIYGQGPSSIERPEGGVDSAQVMLVSDADSGLVQLAQIFEVAPLPSQSAQEIHECLVNHCRQTKIIPREIRVKDPLLGAVLKTFCQQNGILCTVQDILPNAEHAYASILDYFTPKETGQKKSSGKKRR